MPHVPRRRAYPYPCPSCCGTVDLRGGPGRTAPYREAELALPSDLLLPTCDGCDGRWLDARALEDITKALEPVYLSLPPEEHRLLRERARARLRERPVARW